MTASAKSGPQFDYGDLVTIVNSSGVVQESDSSSSIGTGPNGVFMGAGVLDPRFTFLKDKVTGYIGMAPMSYQAALIPLTDAVPAAHGAANIAALANVVSGTAMTLAAASVGVDTNIPISPIGALGNAINANAPITAAVVLDFGFAFGNCTSGSTAIVVADSTKFIQGMPLVIAGVGNSGGTIPLLTNVASITDATHIVVQNAPLATTSAAAIGTGNLWGPSENGYPVPTAHAPYLAKGPGLMLDPRQAIARGIAITGSSSGVGGNFIVAGWDEYWMPMTETIAATAGATVVYGKKAFKAVASVTPQFTDAHNYSVGTSDVFGFGLLVSEWERAQVSWAGADMTASTGFLAGTAPASGDVRGTIQTSTIGGGSGIGSTASNGAVSSLVMGGNRIYLSAHLSPDMLFAAGVTNAVPLYGQAQT